MKFYIISVLLATLLIQAEQPKEDITTTLLAKNVNVVWGKGANCKGRAICYIKESHSLLETDVKILYSPLIDITQVYFPKSTLSETQKDYLNDSESISLDKPSQIDLGNKKITLKKGQYKIHNSEKGYLLVPNK